jgi:hypothetical protein
MIPGEQGEDYPEFEPHCYYCKYFDNDWCIKIGFLTQATDTCEEFDGGQANEQRKL